MSLPDRVTSLEDSRWKLNQALLAVVAFEEKRMTTARQNSICLTTSTDSADSHDEPEEAPSPCVKTEMVDPPTESVQTVIETVAKTAVYPLFRAWLLSDPVNSRNFFQRKIADNGGVRNALFSRERVALQKYGCGLTLEAGPVGLTEAVNRQSDTAFYLFKLGKIGLDKTGLNRNEIARNLRILTDLHTLVGSLIADLKKIVTKK